MIISGTNGLAEHILRLSALIPPNKTTFSLPLPLSVTIEVITADTSVFTSATIRDYRSFVVSVLVLIVTSTIWPESVVDFYII